MDPSLPIIVFKVPSLSRGELNERPLNDDDTPSHAVLMFCAPFYK